MFEAYDVSLKLAASLRPHLMTLRAADAALTTQLARAMASVPLNLSEGSKRAGKDRRHLFRVADGSAAEVRACLDVAVALGYLGEDGLVESRELIDRVLAMCWRLTH